MYIGRFAPSPTGPLHFGSLLAALASFLDARANQGQWLLRIENIDPPREIPETQHKIPYTLEAFGLYWDQDITYQSDRSALYLAALETLIESGLTYSCHCSRKTIIARSGSSHYDRHCRTHTPDLGSQPFASRFAVPESGDINWPDRIQGAFNLSSDQVEDFILRRKDDLWSYHLAVTVDDIEQKITDVVRGYDLLSETPKQWLLHQAFGHQPPSYAHIPVIVGKNGQKLSKQNLARPLDTDQAALQITQALNYLGLNVPVELQHDKPVTILDWAVKNWDINRIPAKPSLTWREE